MLPFFVREKIIHWILVTAGLVLTLLSMTFTHRGRDVMRQNRIFNLCCGMNAANEQDDDGRVLWKGPLFGRLSKFGQDFLVQKCGWSILDGEPCITQTTRLKFVWPSKSGPQFAMGGTQAACIRPYPKHVTDLLDDKLSSTLLFKNQERRRYGTSSNL
jgi:hypothetical protein